MKLLNMDGKIIYESIYSKLDSTLAKAVEEQVDLTGANLSNANLESAHLAGAKLSGANLSNANLSKADLTGADLSRATLIYADLSSVYLTGANLSDVNIGDIEIPVVFDLEKKMVRVVSRGLLRMNEWHSHCGSTHCRAGWAITFAEGAGKNLENYLGHAPYGSAFAGALIYYKSVGYVPDFYATSQEAALDILKRAEAG